MVAAPPEVETDLELDDLLERRAGKLGDLRAREARSSQEEPQARAAQTRWRRRIRVWRQRVDRHMGWGPLQVERPVDRKVELVAPGRIDRTKVLESNTAEMPMGL